MTDWVAVCMKQYASEIPAEAWYNLPQKIPVAEPVVFTGEKCGKRNTEVQASLFDAIHAEILGEHNAEKIRVRNRRACERKARVRNPRYVKRNGGKFRRDVWYEGSKCFHWEEDLRMPERRVRSAEKYDRADWETEQENIIADAVQAAIEAEIREFELRRAVEEANHRWWIMQQNWLEWA